MLLRYSTTMPLTSTCIATKWPFVRFFVTILEYVISRVFYHSERADTFFNVVSLKRRFTHRTILVNMQIILRVAVLELWLEVLILSLM